ncbi:MAG: hypothetical protein U0Z26_20040 [Anaerolineales bacterium]
MKVLNFNNTSETINPEITKAKFAIGISFGLFTGLAFAIAAWIMDGYVLSQAHMYLPWLKLALGMVACGLTGVLVGYLTIKLDRWAISVLLWLVAGAIFAWLVVLLPLQVVSITSAWMKPELNGLLTYSTVSELTPRFWVAVVWISIFTFIVGVLQVPMIEPAVFSTSLFGKIRPILLGVIIMAMSGIMADTFINSSLRGAALSINKTVQFVVDQHGAKIDPQLSRAYHAASLRNVKEAVTESRDMIISAYDPTLGEIEFIILFENAKVKCSVLYNQPSVCSLIK